MPAAQEQVEEVVNSLAVSQQKKRVQRPDETAHKKAVTELDLKIKHLTEEMAALNKLTSESAKTEDSSKAAELRSKLSDLILRRNTLNETRKEYFESIKAIQNGIKRKQDESRTSRDKIGYKSIQDIDIQIANLEKEVGSGTLKLIEEKRVVAEISSLKKAKYQLSGLEDEKPSIELDKKKIDDLRLQIDALESLRNAVREEIETIKAQLDLFNSERSKSMEKVNDIFSKKKTVKQSLDAAYAEKRAAMDQFYQAKQAFFEAMKEEKARKQQEYLARKKEEQNEKIARLAEEELENANIPAFTEEISLIGNLLIFFSQQYGIDTVEIGPKPVAVSENKFDVRRVESIVPDGAQMLAKKDDREEEFFFGKPKSKKQSKKTASAPAKKQVRLDLEMMDRLNKLGVSIPTSVEQVTDCVKELEALKQKFLASQKEKTLENKRKALEKIEALKAAQNAPEATE